MAVGHPEPPVTARVVAEPRRWAAFYCGGIYSVLVRIQASQEDLAGALQNGQLALAQQAARRIVLHCLRVRSLLADGLPEDDGDPFSDVFAGLDPDRVAAALAAAAGVVRSTTVEEATVAVRAVDAEVDDLVRDLGFTAPPQSIRTSAGLFPALRMTRDLLPLNKAAGLPLVFPEGWVSPSARR